MSIAAIESGHCITISLSENVDKSKNCFNVNYGLSFQMFWELFCTLEFEGNYISYVNAL